MISASFVKNIWTHEATAWGLPPSPAVHGTSRRRTTTTVNVPFLVITASLSSSWLPSQPLDGFAPAVVRPRRRRLLLRLLGRLLGRPRPRPLLRQVAPVRPPPAARGERWRRGPVAGRHDTQAARRRRQEPHELPGAVRAALLRRGRRRPGAGRVQDAQGQVPRGWLQDFRWRWEGRREPQDQQHGTWVRFPGFIFPSSSTLVLYSFSFFLSFSRSPVVYLVYRYEDLDYFPMLICSHFRSPIVYYGLWIWR